MSAFLGQKIDTTTASHNRLNSWKNFLGQKIDISAAYPDGLPLWNVMLRVMITAVAIIAAIAAPMAMSGWMDCFFSPPASMTTCNPGLATCNPPQCYCSCSPWISVHSCYRLTGGPGSTCTPCPNAGHQL